MLFTKETLPVGSVIELSAGWTYREEFWKGSDKESSRGPMGSAYRLVVTAEFWDGISERAFNLHKVGKNSYTEADRAEVENAFKIYIPTK